jgi:hypothetical protein
MNRNTHPFKAFLYGMGFGALLMFILLFPGQLKAFDENNDVYCMAQNIYFEAGNQPLAGKIAVAQVVLNRLDHPNYPGTMCEVIYQAKWKENWLGNQVPIRNQCQLIRNYRAEGKDKPILLHFSTDEVYGDITEGATHYHNDQVYPYWADSLNETVIINNHIFYK